MTTRKRRLLVVLAVVGALVGATAVTGAIYVATVDTPRLEELPQGTTVYFSDGRTVMARLGDQHRTVLDPDDIPEAVKEAALADVDPDYRNSSGGPIARRVARWYLDIDGSSAGRERPLRDGSGRSVFGAGLPAAIYRTFMTSAHAALQIKPGRFPPPARGGDPNRGDATA